MLVAVLIQGPSSLTVAASKESTPSPDLPAVLLSSGKGRLLGEVSFSRQEPVAGANIVLVREGDPGRLVLGTTDVRGLFRFESIPEGTWTIGVVREGATPIMKKGIGVHPPARAVLDFVLKKAPGRVDPPVVDLAQYEASVGPLRGGPPMMTVQVIDQAMRPIREGRVLFRSRGPQVDPLRGATDGQGVARMPPPDPGEYLLKIDVPGFLPLRVDRLVLGRTPLVATAVLTPRPLDYPSTPADLLPDEKPAPPEGFPGGPPIGGASRPDP